MQNNFQRRNRRATVTNAQDNCYDTESGSYVRP